MQLSGGDAAAADGLILFLRPGFKRLRSNFFRQQADDAGLGLMSHPVQFPGNLAIFFQYQPAGVHRLLQKRMYRPLAVLYRFNQFFRLPSVTVRHFAARTHGTQNAFFGFVYLSPVLSFGGGALYAFLTEFFGKTDTPFKKVVFAWVKSLPVSISHQYTQMDMGMLGFTFFFRFVMQSKEVLMVGKLFRSEIARGIQYSLRRCSGGHG